VRGTYSLPKNAVAPAGSLLLLGDWLLATTTTVVDSASASGASGLRGALVRWRVGSFGAPSAVFDLGGGGEEGGNSNGSGSRSRNGNRNNSSSSESDFRHPTALCHPPAYVDKVLVAFSSGGLQLWNVAAGAKLHTFRNHLLVSKKEALNDDNDDDGKSTRSSSSCNSITALEASPALDIVALGRGDGSVVLLDARADAALAVFEQAAGPRASSSPSSPSPSSAAVSVPAGLASSSPSPSHPLTCGAITSLAFSTGPEVPLLAAGGEAGGIGFWNLETRALAGALPRAHGGKSSGGSSSSSSSSSSPFGVTDLHFFPGEPRLATAGRDNAIKQWALDGDAASGRGPAPGSREGDLARLLRSREGHAAPPTLLRFYGDGGSRILSAGGPGDRSLRLFSCVRDAASRELSQRNGNKKGIRARAAALGVGEEELRLPRVVSMDASQVGGVEREREWREKREAGGAANGGTKIEKSKKSTVTLFPRERTKKRRAPFLTDSSKTHARGA